MRIESTTGSVPEYVPQTTIVIRSREPFRQRRERALHVTGRVTGLHAPHKKSEGKSDSNSFAVCKTNTDKGDKDNPQVTANPSSVDGQPQGQVESREPSKKQDVAHSETGIEEKRSYAQTDESEVRWNSVHTETLTALENGSDTVRNRGWKKNILTTVFWIGQGRVIPTSATNYMSAWDRQWQWNYGGKDDPQNRAGFVPREFAATLNPFYVALPFNDVAYPELARKWVPWWQEGLGRWVSQCKGRWVEIRNKKGESCFAQWEDVGPFVTNDAEYVFGTARPKAKNGVGLDVSPAVRDYLGLTGRDLTDWRFVEAHEVPPGPWIKYGEQAIIFSALKRKEAKKIESYDSMQAKSAKHEPPNVTKTTSQSNVPSKLGEGL
ncbi:MAG: hypothetical protein NZM04_08675 [Methylacidiphilales bacterium]|nr:hypothetical protein [Candidatus Methylacidiphilales bacterium]MDW8349394.1 hypothetical protein [Verrucomicrobiae bacterium]